MEPPVERVDSLDLLRGLAAFAVMIPHFFMYLGKGSQRAEISAATAVEVFFVLSGFVLGPQIILYAERADFRTVRTFLVRRWVRTVPAYLIALSAISILSGQFGSWNFLRYATYVQNLFSQSNTHDYFPVAWSLSVEEWYYVVFPLFLLVCCKRRQATTGVNDYLSDTALFILAICVGREIFGDLTQWGEHVRRVVVFRIDSIAYGFALYLTLGRTFVEWNPLRRTFAIVAVAIATGVVFWCDVLIADGDANGPKHLYPFASALFGISLIVMFLSLNDFFVGRRSKTLCRYLGGISYPVYLFHLVFLIFIGTVARKEESWTLFFAYMLIVILFSTMFHYGFERPILVMRPQYGRSTRKRIVAA